MPYAHGISVKPIIRLVNSILRVLWRVEAVLQKCFPYFWHSVRLTPTAPRYHRWPTFEYENPYRKSNAHVVRLVGGLGITVGRWHYERMGEVEAASNAAQAHAIEVTTEVADRVRHYGWTVRTGGDQ